MNSVYACSVFCEHALFVIYFGTQLSFSQYLNVFSIIHRLINAEFIQISAEFLQIDADYCRIDIELVQISAELMHSYHPPPNQC